MRAEREMIQSTMELAEHRFVAEKRTIERAHAEVLRAEREMIQSTMELAEQRFVAEKQAIERAHADQRDLWQIELSKEKYLLDEELKSMQVHVGCSCWPER